MKVPFFDYPGIYNRFKVDFDQIFNDVCSRGSFILQSDLENFERELSSYLNVKHAIGVADGTNAIYLGLKALDIGVGDEVIISSHTYVATANAIEMVGATPVFADIDNNNLLCPVASTSKINSKTKAVIVVHMLGVPSRMKEISEICRQKNIFLIEDTAWGCGGRIEDKLLGTWGDIGTFSFDFAKTITTGEGGMLIFKDKEFYEKASAWHDHGHENNPKLPRWEDSRSSSGFNFRMTELQGAVGIAQLKKLDLIIKKQRKNRDLIWEQVKLLRGIKKRGIPVGAYDTADALIFFVKDGDTAKKCREELLKIKVSTKILPEAYTWHFAETWSHMPQLVESHNKDLTNAFPKSRDLLKKCVSIPIFFNMEKKLPQQIKGSLESVL